MTQTLLTVTATVLVVDLGLVIATWTAWKFLHARGTQPGRDGWAVLYWTYPPDPIPHIVGPIRTRKKALIARDAIRLREYRAGVHREGAGGDGGRRYLAHTMELASWRGRKDS